MTAESFLMGILLGIPAAYVLHSLRFDRVTGHEGPFKSKTLTVLFPRQEITHSDGAVEMLTEHEQRVSLFDWIRRPFGVYKVQGSVWEVQPDAAERWTCPFCLSFWVSVPFSLFYCAMFGHWWWLLPIHFGIATVAVIFALKIDRMMQ